MRTNALESSVNKVYLLVLELQTPQPLDESPGLLLRDKADNVAVEDDGQGRSVPTPPRVEPEAQPVNRRHAERGKDDRVRGRIHVLADNLAVLGQVVEEPARLAVRRVDGADEAPRVGSELAHVRRPHREEETAAVDRLKVGQVAGPGDVLDDDRSAVGLGNKQVARRADAPGREELLHDLANLHARLQRGEDFL